MRHWGEAPSMLCEWLPLHQDGIRKQGNREYWRGSDIQITLKGLWNSGLPGLFKILDNFMFQIFLVCLPWSRSVFDCHCNVLLVAGCAPTIGSNVWCAWEFLCFIQAKAVGLIKVKFLPYRFWLSSALKSFRQYLSNTSAANTDYCF